MDWTETIAIIQGVISFAIAIAAFYFARKKDTSENAAQSMELIVELRTLRRDVGELKGDVQAMRSEWKNDHDILIGVSREVSAMWKIIDKIQGKKKEDEG